MSSICEACGALQTPSRSRSSAPVADIPLPELTSLLASNDPPLDSDYTRILDIISVGQDRIDVLDSQIRALQTRLAPLVRERDETVKHVRERRAIVSPLRRVPPEVLCEIFASSIEGSESGEEPPWYLGHICQSWRRIALGYPGLWTHLIIREDLPCIEEQLLRAGNALLDVYWSGRQNKENVGLADLMGPHYGRWRALRIDYVFNHAPEWLRFANGHLDQLETLEMTGSPDVAIPIFLSVAPNLRHVFLNDLDFAECCPWIPVPWAQITHYRGTFLLHRQVEVLQTAQNLLVCSVGFFGDISDPPSPLLVLPRLRRLSTESAKFLSYLNVPALQELTSLYTPRVAMPRLLSLISNSCCTLTTLALFSFSLDMVFLSVLEALPSLAHLFVECGNISTDTSKHTAVFRAMTLPTPPLLCPNLTSLVYGYRGPDMAPEQAFFDMTSSRFSRTSDRLHNLQRLCIFAIDKRPPPERIIDAIAMLRVEGHDAAFLDEREARELKRRHQF
ncbi:hypothetical protein C8R46DRAFT_424167 [Mycena filopes]|nr:hypothetical protein C8R46DRAFT_424167 [Mycena filopes]